MRKTVGGLDYKAPELVDGINNPFSVDIWSLGIIFLELNFGKKIRAL
jgi:serine/threonine protein kinase